jgi:hypothetical protein
MKERSWSILSLVVNRVATPGLPPSPSTGADTAAQPCHPARWKLLDWAPAPVRPRMTTRSWDGFAPPDSLTQRSHLNACGTSMGPQIWSTANGAMILDHSISRSRAKNSRKEWGPPTGFAYSFDRCWPLALCTPAPCHPHPPPAQPRCCFTANKHQLQSLLLFLLRAVKNTSLSPLQHSNLRDCDIDFTPPSPAGKTLSKPDATMLDSNLPSMYHQASNRMLLTNSRIAYYFKPSADKNRPYESSLLFTQFDSDPEPRYLLRQPDPAAPTAKNCYAVGLFDTYIPDVLFGEVLVKPEWTQPSISQDEIRRNGGIPPRPQPVIPTDFTIQLYSPDQQVVVREEKASWGGTPTYHFSMPQISFRTPSASTLDRATNDPFADPSTPQIKFVWKRDGKMTKDLSCFMTGKSTDTQKKKKGGKEPDIAVAIFTGFKDVTIYESNLHRVDVEDYKGLELVVLLGAMVIRDIYCGQKKDCFNVGEAARKNSGGLVKRKQSIPMLTFSDAGPSPPLRPTGTALQSNGLPRYSQQRRQSMPLSPPLTPMYSKPPPPDPRAQWEIDAEAARLRKAAEQEKRAEEARQRERLKREEEETKRIKKMVEAEEKERRRREAEVEKETNRLRKKYGDQSNLIPPAQPAPQRHSFPMQQQQRPAQPPRPIQTQQIRPQSRPQTRPSNNSPYLQQPQHNPFSVYAPPIASTSSFFQHRPNQQPKPKKSFWGLRSPSPSQQQPRLSRQRSTMF